MLSDGAPGSKGSGSKINKAASQAAAAQEQSAATSAQRASSANSAAAAAPASSSQYANLLEKAAAQQTQAAAAAAATAAAAQTEEVRQRTTFGRTASILGNSLLISGLGIASFFGYYTLKYTPDEVAALVDAKSNSSAAPDQAWVSVMSWYVEKRRQAENEVARYAEPPSDALLPDHPPNMRHVKTLVLDLDDVLVKSDWTRARGWRTFKRPGVEDFLFAVAQRFEVVVYTSQLPTYADPILDRLDPHRGCIAYRLYRDSTLWKNGKHMRDLGKLNRDLANVLLVTADPGAAGLNPDNCIKLEPWKLDDDEDTKLLDLIPFLEAVQQSKVSDVRDVVRSYEGEDIPTAFRDRMARLQQAPKKPRSFLGFSRS